MSAEHFDFFYRPITPDQSFELHRSLEVHSPRDRWIFRRNLDSKVARTGLLVVRFIIGFRQAQKLRAEMNVRPLNRVMRNLKLTLPLSSTRLIMPPARRNAESSPTRRTLAFSEDAIAAGVFFRSDARKKTI